MKLFLLLASLVALAAAATFPARNGVASCCIRPVVILESQYSGSDWYTAPSLEFSTTPVCIDGQSAAWRSFVRYNNGPREVEETEEGNYYCEWNREFGTQGIYVASRFDCLLLNSCQNDFGLVPYVEVSSDTERSTNGRFGYGLIQDMYYGDSIAKRGVGNIEEQGQLSLSAFPGATCGDIAQFCV